MLELPPPILMLGPHRGHAPQFDHHSWWKDDRKNWVSSDLLCNARASPPDPGQ